MGKCSNCGIEDIEITYGQCYECNQQELKDIILALSKRKETIEIKKPYTVEDIKALKKILARY